VPRATPSCCEPHSSARRLDDRRHVALRQAEAEVAVARAALDAAQLQLARTRIVAPIAGRIEVSTVTQARSSPPTRRRP
jgi:multidrug resistance efflux pump